ncbi:uncharacterized protein METZ01_LOCUS78765 [marine metagenome]|uniref:Uncharacterized protein n=1 Tax=marine metagenome TaxID=408172 RepID=A0A381UDT2_9ZZZZ
MRPEEREVASLGGIVAECCLAVPKGATDN